MRDNVIDVVKGFAIFLVVIGHLMQNSIVNYDHNVLWRFIYSFHMPLFFFISGFVAFFTKSYGVELILKRFKSLIIPFFLWAVVYYFTKDKTEMGFLEYLLDIILIPDKVLWFLWVLFYCYFLLVIAKKIPVNIYIVFVLISVFLLTFSIVIKDKIFGINLISKQFPFFILGFMTNNYKEFIFEKIKKYRFIILFLFFIGASFWMRKEDPLFYKYLDLGGLFKLGYIFLVGILGVFSSLILFIEFKEDDTNIFIKLLSFLGKHTLAVYTVHFLVLDFFKIEYTGNFIYYLIVLLFSILILSICLLIEYMISFNTIAYKLLFGTVNKFRTFK